MTSPKIKEERLLLVARKWVLNNTGWGNCLRGDELAASFFRIILRERERVLREAAAKFPCLGGHSTIEDCGFDVVRKTILSLGSQK